MQRSDQDPRQEFWCGCVACSLASLLLKSIQISSVLVKYARIACKSTKSSSKPPIQQFGRSRTTRQRMPIQYLARSDRMLYYDLLSPGVAFQKTKGFIMNQCCQTIDYFCLYMYVYWTCKLSHNVLCYRKIRSLIESI